MRISQISRLCRYETCARACIQCIYKAVRNIYREGSTQEILGKDIYTEIVCNIRRRAVARNSSNQIIKRIRQSYHPKPTVSLGLHRWLLFLDSSDYFRLRPRCRRYLLPRLCCNIRVLFCRFQNASRCSLSFFLKEFHST